MKETSGILETTAILDREQRDKYLLTGTYYLNLFHNCPSVYAFDNTYPVKYDAATIIVNIVDVNDHEPELTKPVCLPLNVPENVPITNLHTLIANDGDHGDNGLVSYAIIGELIYGKD